MRMSFGERKIVVITGAAGNLGAEVAQLFLLQGDRLVLIDRQPDRLAQLYPRLVDEDHLLLGDVDLTDPVAVSVAIDAVKAKYHRIDALIHTAGGYRALGKVHQMSVDDWDFMLNLNARTAFIICHAVIPVMLEARKGAIVLIGARPGLSGMANASAYSASKSAVLRLMESMSAEYKQEGIRVNAVVPATIDTPQNREAMPDANFDRWVKPHDIAEVIRYLASDQAAGVSGAAVPVFGQL
jgi:NAD(P)-dependent dehydrogenase (short-subunit alcohol dehydrogenase family)